jgi:disulfide bond formation protein DsbB
METHPLYATTLNHYFSILTILGCIFIAVFIIRAIYLITYKKRCPIAPFVTSYIFPIGFFLSALGTGLSLFYSEVLKYIPCDLCWYQRIFLYPQVFMFGYAWYKKDYTVLRYSMVLSVVGTLIAAYHHMLQIGFDLMKPCSSAPFAVDCAKPSFVEFGFVTFPLMSFVLFGFLIIASFIATVLAKQSK